MKRHLLIAAALLATSGAAQAQGRGERYQAVGTEPFWSVSIQNGRMIYRDPENRTINVRAPRARPSFNGRRYVTPRLSVDITRQRCSDGMSDRIYPDTVRVMAHGRELRGCGGSPLPADTLANTSWSIVSINGRAVPGGERYQISFGHDQISGKAGCNGFGGSYRVSSDGMRAGPLAMTRMACPGPAMEHEQAFARIMQDTVRLYYPDGMSMIIRGPAGEIRLRRRS